MASQPHVCPELASEDYRDFNLECEEHGLHYNTLPRMKEYSAMELVLLTRV